MNLSMKSMSFDVVMCRVFHTLRCPRLTTLTRGMFLLILLLMSTVADIVRIPLKRSNKVVSAAVNPPGEDFFTQQKDNLKGKPGQGYFIEVELGTPPQKLNVLVDTGSSNFAVAAAPHQDILKYFHFKSSTTYVSHGTTIYVPYTQGNWEGTLGTDIVRFPSLPGVEVRANIASITSSDKFFINGSNWQGILGMGYKEIARPDSSIEPFFDSLTTNTKVDNIFSMQLCGTVDFLNQTDVSMGGTLVLGGVDKNLYDGPILYAPIYKEWYYEVVLTDIAVADQSLGMDCKEYNFDKSIVDSGTTNLRLPKKVFSRLVRLIKSKATEVLPSPIPDKFWSGLDILCWEQGQTPFSAYPLVSLTLMMDQNTTFELHISPQQYLRALGNTYNDNSRYKDCYKFAITQSTTGTVIGAVVMEGFYVVFDRANKRIGFAQSVCNARDPSNQISSVRGPIQTHANIESCVYIKPQTDQSTLMIVAYVMAGVCALCMIPVLISLVQWQIQKCRGRRQEVADISSLLKG